MFNKPVVVIDVETTSLDPYNRVIWDIGMVRLNSETLEIEDMFQSFVSITQREIDRADPKSLDIGGFDKRYNEYEALSKRTIAGLVHDFTKDCYLAGIVVDFDVRSLTDLLHTYGMSPKWDYHIIDIRTLIVGSTVNSPNPLDFTATQDDLANRLELDTIFDEDRHTAIGDAEFAAYLLQGLMASR